MTAVSVIISTLADVRRRRDAAFDVIELAEPGEPRQEDKDAYAAAADAEEACLQELIRTPAVCLEDILAKYGVAVAATTGENLGRQPRYEDELPALVDSIARDEAALLRAAE